MTEWAGTEEQHAVAVLAAINAQLAAAGVDVTAYDDDEVRAMSPKPTEYVAVAVYRRFNGDSRLHGSKGVGLHRIVTRYSADRVTNSRTLRTQTRLALEEKRLAIAGATTTPIQFETATRIEPDDDWFTGMDQWTYGI